MDIDFNLFKNVVKVKRPVTRNRSYGILLPRSWYEDMKTKNIMLSYDPINKIITIVPTELPITMKPRGFKRVKI
jgi:hypothetical protein